MPHPVSRALEVGVEHADLRDPVHRQAVVGRGLADRLRAGRVVDAERPAPVLAHVGVSQVTPCVRVSLDDRQRHGSAPAAVQSRAASPSGNVRSTTYRGISVLLRSADCSSEAYGARPRRASEEPPRLGGGAYLSWPAMPSRAAAAAASPRVRTSSLRRIAETWWSTVLAERNSRSAISALRSPWATSAEDLELARGEAGGVLLGSRPRPARAARARRARAAAARRSPPPAARPSRCSSSSAPAQARRRRRRRAPARPRRGSRARSRAPAARAQSPAICERVRLGRVRRGLLLDARPASASRRARRSTTAPAAERELERALRVVSRRPPRGGPRARRPRRARPRRADPLQLARRLGEPMRLVERRPVPPGLRAAPARSPSTASA